MLQAEGTPFPLPHLKGQVLQPTSPSCHELTSICQRFSCTARPEIGHSVLLLNSHTWYPHPLVNTLAEVSPSLHHHPRKRTKKVIFWSSFWLNMFFNIRFQDFITSQGRQRNILSS